MLETQKYIQTKKQEEAIYQTCELAYAFDTLVNEALGIPIEQKKTLIQLLNETEYRRDHDIGIPLVRALQTLKDARFDLANPHPRIPSSPEPLLAALEQCKDSLAGNTGNHSQSFIEMIRLLSLKYYQLRQDL